MLFLSILFTLNKLKYETKHLLTALVTYNCMYKNNDYKILKFFIVIYKETMYSKKLSAIICIKTNLLFEPF